jgi:hypothetical protein
MAIRPTIRARTGELFFRQLNTVLDWLKDGIEGRQVTLVSGANLKTVNGTSLLGSGNLSISGGGGGADSFETVAKNLSADDATFTWSGGNLTSISYANGITKTLGYTGDDLTTVVLSGSTPGGIELTKTLIYSGGNLASFSYS